MSNAVASPSPEDSEEPSISTRCPYCDMVVLETAEVCLMCGNAVESWWFDLDRPDDLIPMPEKPEIVEAKDEGGRGFSRPRLFPSEKRPTPLAISAITAVLLTACLWIAALATPQTFVALAQVATRTPTVTVEVIPTQTATSTATSTATAVPTEAVTSTPTITLTPTPTETPLPPRTHNVQSGQTLVGIAIFYDITLASIQALNQFNNETILFSGQEILIPWPTPTPPLQAIAIDIGESQVIVDPSNCPPFYSIQEGDSLILLAARNNVPLNALLELNFLTVDSIVQPGDVICIPEVIEGGFLPPTPGPSPTPSLTPPPSGPQLLFPADNAPVAEALQWLAVKPLSENEWYMVEVLDITDVTSYPRRGFTRATSFQIPDSWKAADGEPHLYQWKVSIVQKTGEREDGSFIFTYGGRESETRTFVGE